MLSYVNVTKKYGEITALDNVTVEFKSGVVNALLGPNGSGKSTMMKIAIGLIKPDSGSVSVDGVDPSRDPVSARRIIGYSPEEIVLYESLTPAELFSFVGSIYRIPKDIVKERINQLIRLFKLEEHMGKLIGELSHGNRRKVSLVLSLLHEPRVLLLDEPFSGLDPQAGRILKELMRKHARDGRTVVFSTHILEIAEAVAENIVIMSNGRVVGSGSPDELKKRLSVSDMESAFLKATGLSEEVREMIRILWGSE
ncbi:MAG: ABC transporter ATP-binding protein [Thermoproteota archaeon]|jgi:ABC-2 type transport system ATP-binding protein|uniref:ABC transporter ATP-binding protein n=1 Tax=Candidatus Methanodesulfokora washburnensis TaxID=2478471 RepID=A0A520KIY2_9CREN|nr:MAG: ABC transporter ATP-binding protein [Candidatus Methanodesulfokores washburnensis]TDA41044.1 MAG: ABC transporter ATP-binding protein [Candidatus Korarchaeota archaeon]